MRTEYVVCVLSFLSMQMCGIEMGMGVGVLLSMASFVFTYSQLQSVSAAYLRSSTVVRTFEDRQLLIASRGKVVTISLDGYIFFGSAVQILEDVKRHVFVSANINNGQTGRNSSVGPKFNFCVSNSSNSSQRQYNSTDQPAHDLLIQQATTTTPLAVSRNTSFIGMGGGASSSPTYSHLLSVYDLSGEDIERHNKVWVHASKPEGRQHYLFSPPLYFNRRSR